MKTFLANGLIYVGAALTPALVGFLTVIVYTRWMSADVYGVYTLVMLVSSVFGSTVFGWLHSGLTRFWDDATVGREKLRKLLFTSLFVVFVPLALILMVTSIVNDKVGDALVVLALLLSAVLFDFCQRLNFISQRRGMYFRAEIVHAVLIGVLSLGLVALGYSWQGAVLGVVASNVAVVLLFGEWRNVWQAKGRVLEYAVFKKLAFYGVPLSISYAMIGLMQMSERVLIGWFHDYNEVGQYAATYNPVRQIFFMIAASLHMAAYPLILKTLEDEGITAVSEKMREYLVFYLGIMLALAVGFLAVSDVFLPILIGEAFREKALVWLPWVIVSVVLHSFYMFFTSLFFQINKQTVREAKLVGVMLALNVLMNLLILPLYGAVSVAFTASLSFLSIILYGGFMARGDLRINPPWQDLLNILLLLVLMYFLVRAVPFVFNPVMTLLFKILTGMLFYLLGVLVLNVGDAREYLKAGLGKFFMPKPGNA